MDSDKLMQAQSVFFAAYPGGFSDLAMAPVMKKHRMGAITEFAQAAFAPAALADASETAQNAIRLVSRSTIVSLFEKPRFRDFVRAMDTAGRAELSGALADLLHQDEARGFHRMLGILHSAGLAKWTLMTVWRCYVHPSTDLLFKPTTVKRVIETFGLHGLQYRPQPSYSFFTGYRSAVQQMAAAADPRLSPSLPAFSGFLMTAMDLMA